MSIKLAAACRRTDHPRYRPALEIVDRPSAYLARSRGRKQSRRPGRFKLSTKALRHLEHTDVRHPLLISGPNCIRKTGSNRSSRRRQIWQSPESSVSIRLMSSICSVFRVKPANGKGQRVHLSNAVVKWRNQIFRVSAASRKTSKMPFHRVSENLGFVSGSVFGTRE